MFIKGLVVTICVAIAGIAAVAFLGGFSREILESHAMDYVVGGLMLSGMAICVGSYLWEKRSTAR